MKSHHLFLLLLFFLVSCAPSTSVPIVPTATPVPTSTLTPIPTPTQTATSTPEAWIAGKENSGVELPSELFEFVKDQHPILSADGRQILNAETNEVLLEEKDGEWEMLRKSYGENYEVSDFLAPENYVPPEEIAGEYLNWVNAKIKPEVKAWFDSHRDEIKTGVEIWEYIQSGNMFYTPAFSTAPNYPNKNDSPHTKWIYHHTVLKFDKETELKNKNGEVVVIAYSGEEWLYTVAPLFSYDVETGEVSTSVVVYANYRKDEASSLIQIFDGMGVTPIGESGGHVSGFDDPLVAKIMRESGITKEDMSAATLEFKNGNFAACDGLVLTTKVADSEIFE